MRGGFSVRADGGGGYVGVPRPNVALGTASEKPRAEVLPKRPKLWGVSLEDLVIVGSEQKRAKSNDRPAGKVREVLRSRRKAPMP